MVVLRKVIELHKTQMKTDLFPVLLLIFVNKRSTDFFFSFIWMFIVPEWQYNQLCQDLI